MDLQNIKDRVTLWQKYLPSVSLFYAVKTNPNEKFIKALIALGCGFDCASKAEIDLVLRLGGKAEDIIYANPVKSKSQLIHAKKTNVKLMTCDSFRELRDIAEIFPEAEVVIRLKIDKTDAVYKFDKFGISKSQWKPML